MRLREQNRRHPLHMLPRGDRWSPVEGLSKIARLDDGVEVDAGTEIVRMVIGPHGASDPDRAQILAPPQHVDHPVEDEVDVVDERIGTARIEERSISLASRAFQWRVSSPVARGGQIVDGEARLAHDARAVAEGEKSGGVILQPCCDGQLPRQMPLPHAIGADEENIAASAWRLLPVGRRRRGEFAGGRRRLRGLEHKERIVVEAAPGGLGNADLDQPLRRHAACGIVVRRKRQGGAERCGEIVGREDPHVIRLPKTACALVWLQRTLRLAKAAVHEGNGKDVPSAWLEGGVQRAGDRPVIAVDMLQHVIVDDEIIARRAEAASIGTEIQPGDTLDWHLRGRPVRRVVTSAPGGPENADEAGFRGDVKDGERSRQKAAPLQPFVEQPVAFEGIAAEAAHPLAQEGAAGLPVSVAESPSAADVAGCPHRPRPQPLENRRGSRSVRTSRA